MTALVFAPHADDEVLGMGATIARLVQQKRRVVVAVLTGHGAEPHPLWPRKHWDLIREECKSAVAILGVTEIIFREMPAACLDALPAWQINREVDEVIRAITPAEVYVPFPFDLHKDHGAVAYAVTVACRPYLDAVRQVRRLLAYETLSETHLAPAYLAPAFQPNVFVDVTATIELKCEALRAYKSQIQHEQLPRSISAVQALATLRGAHIGCSAAEAFVLLGEYRR